MSEVRHRCRRRLASGRHSALFIFLGKGWRSHQESSESCQYEISCSFSVVDVNNCSDVRSGLTSEQHVESGQHEQREDGRRNDATDHDGRGAAVATSAPAPVAIAIGRSLADATSAVTRTGRSRVSAPSRVASTRGTPSRRSRSIKVMMTRPLSTATPDSAMKPMPALMESGIAPQQKSRNTASKGKRHTAKHQQRIGHRPEADEEQ